MALIDKASLLMVPSVYEDGTLYNVLPSGNKAPDETGNHNAYDQTRADFTFSRGSNLAATRVNANGLIEKGRENLLLQSNQFDTTWYNSNSTETGGQADKDGGTDAWLLTKTSTNGGIRQNNTTTGVQTFSFYAKAADSNWVKVNNLGSSAYHQANFDLVNGVVGTTAYIIDAKIEDVGNGWFRCITTYNATLVNIDVRVADSDNVVSGTSGSIYIQNAQLELGLAASTYLDSGATTATAGVLENTPRIDYSSGAGALLLESQRTNLYTHSEYYDSYTKASCTITSNATTSPEGLQNASKIVSQSGGPNIKRIQPSISTSGTNEYIISAFVKKAEWHYFFIYGAGTLVNGSLTIFNLDNGTIEQGSGHATIEAFGDDGWYKITWKATSTGTGTGDPRIGITDNASSSNSTGDGVSGAYLYGLQIEQASHASSYVPTYGSAATRGADSCSVTGASDVIGQSEGTMFVEAKPIEANGDAFYQTSISDGTNNNAGLLSFTTTSGQVRFRFENGGIVQAQIYADGIDTSSSVKMAMAYKANDFVLYVNGVQAGTDTSGSIPSFSQIQFANGGNNTTQMYGSVYQVLLSKTRLTNSELADLTA